MSIITRGYGAARVPALVVTQGYVPPLDWRGRYQSARGLAHGPYRYVSTQGEDDAVAAIPVPPTPQVVYLRSRERNVPLQLDLARDVAASDTLSSATITVLAQPLEQEGGVPTTDVTSALLVGQAAAGTVVSALLGNANAQPGTEYTVRIVATMHSGLVLQETIGGGPESRIMCDM